ncbi:MAG TPA: hypothetical protein VLG68_07215 [Gammaproteobacteria bacterium]|nr:hypothetical protein [Gammaproteobacteria bacterium]
MTRLAALLLFGLIPGLALADAGPIARTLNADIPAAGLDTLALRVGVGAVHLTAAGDDRVHVVVKLRQKEQEFLWFFHWASSGSAQDIAAASITQERQGGRLSLSIKYPSKDDEEDLKQEWQVQLPARLAAKVDMNVGELSIEGNAGGVDAKLNVGELSIDSLRGPLSASVNVGEIRVKSASAQHGEISLSSNIGDAELYIKGEKSGSKSHGGLGNSLSLEGSGPDNMKLSVNIGEVSLRLAPPDDKGGGK